MNISVLPMNMRAKVIDTGDCWIWTGAIQTRGYGSVTDGRGKPMLAHRRAYIEAIGPIPEGLTIDHLCMNKSCVNPDHLEPVTVAENNRRQGSPMGHCRHGYRVEVSVRPRGDVDLPCPHPPLAGFGDIIDRYFEALPAERRAS